MTVAAKKRDGEAGIKLGYQITLRRLGELEPFAANARTHSAEQVAEIAASIAEYGWTNPILADGNGGIVAGHGRRLAAIQIYDAGRTIRLPSGEQIPAGMVPVIDCTGWTAKQKRAYVLADNQLALKADWDLSLLRQEIDGLRDDGVSLDAIGFSAADLDAIFGKEPTEPAPPRMSLAESFGVVPFSVLNAREGWWQDRKAAWLALGIKSEIGRGENLLRFSDTINEPDPKKRAMAKNGRRKAATFGQDLMRGEHVVGERKEGVAIVGGQGWGGGPARRDAAFYEKKRSWERENGREISTPEFREKYWDGAEPKKSGLTYGTAEWAQRKIADGDIQGGMAAGHSGTSIFDPVLCELAYRWFTAPGDAILDPFAGGSVRGVVAGVLGRSYRGIELRAEQVAANQDQGREIIPTADVAWIEGDSRNAPELLGADAGADFAFSCPPYADLEIYSDDPRDLSTMDYAEFVAAYREIIAKAAAVLRPDRFACFVVWDIRDKSGAYRNFVGHTVEAFEAAGLRLYNEAILVTAAGSLPIRTRRQFEIGRKLGKTHQNVLVFVKGDWRAATARIGAVEFGAIDADGDQGAQSSDGQ